MKVLGWLVFSSILCGVYASQCIYDTMKCSRFWQARHSPWWFFSPRMFWVGDEDLQIVCRLQQRFFNCIDEVSKKSGELMHPIFVEPMILFRVLCDEKSMLHNLFLRWSLCINRNEPTYLDYCVPPEIRRPEVFQYGQGLPEPDCKYRAQADKCISTYITHNCSETAAWIFSLLNIMMNVIEYDKCTFPRATFSTMPPTTAITSTILPSTLNTESLNQTTYETVSQHPVLRRTGDHPLRKKKAYSTFKPKQVHSMDYIKSDWDVKQRKILYDDIKSDKSGEYLHIDPSAKWLQELEMTSRDGITESKESSILDYLEKSSNPLKELENIISDYIDTELAEQNARRS